MRTPEETKALAAQIRSKSAKDYLEKASKEKKQSMKESTMHEDFAAIGDIITLVANDQPADASVIINDLLGARVSDALAAHKQDIAKTLFAPSADALAEEIVQEEHESVEDFVKRGGKIKQVPAHKSYSAPKAQTIKVPFRMGKAVKEEAEQLDEKNWIAGAIKKPGALHKQLGVPQDKKIPAGKLEAAAEKGGKLGKRARLAQTLKSLHKEEVEQLDEMPTRKHFQQVADVIKAHPDAAKRKELAAHHAGIFKTQNPRFDHKRFYAAANAGEPGV